MRGRGEGDFLKKAPFPPPLIPQRLLGLSNPCSRGWRRAGRSGTGDGFIPKRLGRGRRLSGFQGGMARRAVGDGREAGRDGMAPVWPRPVWG